jgi:DNA-3-methyladenine glycosylase II
MSDEPLATRGPFHLEATVRLLQRRPNDRVELWEHERYLRVLRSENELSLLEVRNEGTVEQPDVRFRVRAGRPSTSARGAFAQTLRRCLGLDVEIEPLALRAGAERNLRPMARALRGMRPPRFADLFETFAQVIPFQQVSLEAGSAIVGYLYFCALGSSLLEKKLIRAA